MRDDGRDQETIDLSLHPRQVVSIVLGSAVVLGIVFYLGVTVGKDLAAPPVAPPGDLLGALDEKAEAAERLTFADDLTRAERAAQPQAAVAPAAPAAKPDAARMEKPPADESAPPEAPQAAEAQAEASPAEDVVAPAPPAKEPVRDLSAALLNAGAEKGTRDAKAAREAAAPAGAKEPRAAETAAAQPAAKPAIAPPQGPSFTVQVASLPNRAEAEALAARLRKQGLSPWVAEADIPGKGTFYRVRVGRFSSREQAVRYLEDLKRETRMDGFVASVDL